MNDVCCKGCLLIIDNFLFFSSFLIEKFTETGYVWCLLVIFNDWKQVHSQCHLHMTAHPGTFIIP